MLKNLRMGSVSYSNSLPLTYTLDHLCSKGTPAELTQKILNHELDLALLPVASILKHNLQAYPQAGLIGCDGFVKSVGFFTRDHIQSLDDIQTVYLDIESKTSVLLAQIILKRYFKRNLKSIQHVSLADCHKADAQVLIGDKALFFSEPGYQYHDLGQLWKDYTGKGFIFACWASQKPLSRLVIEQLDQAKHEGLRHLEDLAKTQIEKSKQSLTLDYWKNNIIYNLNDSLKGGFEIFEKCVREENFFTQNLNMNTHYKYLNPSQPQNIFAQDSN